MRGFVSFIGAGPGDPELITLKGKNAIERADTVIYAGSLVSPAVLSWAKPGAEIYDSSALTLEQTHSLARKTALAGGRVARVHTGDPTIYGALAEQIELLDRDGIDWEIIPGVTAAFAAAAKAGISFSVPEISQSLLITRIAGRTPMPENETLAKLASSGVAMAVYLAGHKAKEAQAELLRSLPACTPVICASRVGWQEERIIAATLGNLAQVAQENGIGRQTVILVLPHLAKMGARSRLYANDFSHGRRKARSPEKMRENSHNG